MSVCHLMVMTTMALKLFIRALGRKVVSPWFVKRLFLAMAALAVYCIYLYKTSLPDCEYFPSNLISGRFRPRFESPEFSEIHRLYPMISPGGLYKPPGCKAKSRVAIIVPFRNRTDHLKTLLLNLHPFLIKQQLEYGIYVVEQVMPGMFNKGMLMNIGYLEAMKRHDYQCVVFHDVDLLPEDNRNIYSCPLHPRHLAASIDKFNYTLPDDNTIFGGASQLNLQQMTSVNGYSNLYFGWGGEDNEMESRLGLAGLNRTQYDDDIAKYKMIKHSNDKSNPLNSKNNLNIWESVGYRMPFDGLNSIKYFDIEMIDELPTYTMIRIYIDEASAKQSVSYVHAVNKIQVIKTLLNTNAGSNKERLQRLMNQCKSLSPELRHLIPKCLTVNDYYKKSLFRALR